ncbi:MULTISPECIES: helicase associated domain-containing protein [Kitasatospora]|uniref:helicase associated domain-containing protein n=1 Tax=Kitasatospora TaxID=2063 RepID=UPI0031D93FB5
MSGCQTGAAGPRWTRSSIRAAPAGTAESISAVAGFSSAARRRSATAERTWAAPVPTRTTSSCGKDRQRHLGGQGLLDPARVSELDALGMIWSKNAGAWERGAAYAAAFHRQHGHLAIPATAKLDDYAVGAWMRRQRKADNLNPDQIAKLDSLDELWRLEPDWNRSYRRLLAYLAAGGTLDGPANRTGLGDDPTFRPGTWLRKQATARTAGKLTDHQTALLDALHWHAETVAG